MKKMMFLFFVVISTFTFADNIVISDTVKKYDVYMKTNAVIKPFTVSTIKRDAYPAADVGDPIFWFDASYTNDWTFAEGTLDIVKIPSKVGARYLSIYDEGGSWSKWSKKWQQLSPVLETGVAALQGGNAVDFGVQGSLRGLLFNPVTDEYTCNTPSNILANIGTIITVYNSENGGGFFMGGGFKPENGPGSAFANGYLWHRNTTDDFASKGPGRLAHVNNITRGSAGRSFQAGIVRLDGISYGAGSCSSIGFNGSWEIVSVILTNNNMEATGLGLNDARMSKFSGGMKIAEMLIFDKVLTHEQCEKIEDWLALKWFNRSRLGVNANAQISELSSYRDDWVPRSRPIEFDIPENEKLIIGRNLAGRGGNAGPNYDPIPTVTNLASLVKKGKGTLILKDTIGYQGYVRLQEGSLEVPQKEVPTSLPHNAYLHFDASNEESLITTQDGQNEYVDIWRNITDKTFYFNPVSARSDSEHRPLILRNALGEGKNVVDFGKFFDSDAGKYLTLTTNETLSISDSNIVVPRVMTVVALMGAQYGGGHLIGHSSDNYFRRNLIAVSNYTDKVYAHNVNGTKLYLDGVFSDDVTTVGFATPGYQAFALVRPMLHDQSKGNIKFLGSSMSKSGGMRIAELAIYNRALSDEEICDAHAYLLRKWLNRTAPGYKVPSGFTAPVIQNVFSEGGAINVPEGEELVLGSVTGSVNLVKTGLGTLKIQKNNLQNGATIEIREGIVESAESIADVNTSTEIASYPSLHLTADDITKMECIERDGEKLVCTWYDVNNLNTAFRHAMSESETDLNYTPALIENALNSKSCLDFKELGIGGRGLLLARKLDSVRSAFVVWKPYSQPMNMLNSGVYPMVLGSYDAPNMADFLRQKGNVFAEHHVARMASDGEIRIDGDLKAKTFQVVNDVWQLHEYHTIGGSHVSAIGSDREIAKQIGGFALAEVILYERVLTEREKIATRNYLNKKWFAKTDDELDALPENPSLVTTNLIGKIAVNVLNSIQNDEITKVHTLTGNGTFAKSGEETLIVGDWSGFSGKVQINEGTLSVIKKSPISRDEENTFTTRGLIYHADAKEGLTLVTNEIGAVEIREWKSRLNDGWSAVPIFDGCYPTMCSATELNGEMVVDMAQGVKQGLLFKKDGVQEPLQNIRSIFWLIGSQNGGGFLMGGGTNAANSSQRYNFHRYTPKDPIQASDGLINNSHGQREVRDAAWRKNQASVVSYNTSLSGGWDLLSMNMSASGNATQAEGFAFDGRVLNPKPSQQSRVGGQRLAEVLIYDTHLTDEEIRNTENYLISKWNFMTQNAVAENVEVEIANGATLDLGGMRQEVGSISGAGIIANGTVVPNAITANSSGAYITSTANLELPQEMIIDISEIDFSGVSTEISIPLIKASSVTGLDNDFIYIASGNTTAFKFSLSWDSKTQILSVKVSKLGLTILIK